MSVSIIAVIKVSSVMMSVEIVVVIIVVWHRVW